MRPRFLPRRPVADPQACEMDSEVGVDQQGRYCQRPVPRVSMFAGVPVHEPVHQLPRPTRRDRLGLLALAAWSVVAWCGFFGLCGWVWGQIHG